MRNYRIERPFSSQGVNQIKKRMMLMQSRIGKLEDRFMALSLEYIKSRAIYHVRRTTGNSTWYEQTYALENSFVIDYNLKSLINHQFYAAWVEYGTGIKGDGTHPEPGSYEYNLNNHTQWSFEYKDMKITTTGMVAHRFMYNAIQDYLNGAYGKIFEKTFNSVMGGILK